MANLSTADAAGMADGLLSSNDEPVVPAQYAAHADVYREAFHRVRNAMGGGYMPRRSKPASEDKPEAAAAGKPARVKPTPAPKPAPAPTLPPKPPMEAALERLLQSA